MVTQAQVHGWAGGLAAVVGRIAPRFGRAEPRHRAKASLPGLRAVVARKNGWQRAAAAGDRPPDGEHDFLSRMPWDADAVRDALPAHVMRHLADDAAVPVIDETGFLEKAAKSAGVARPGRGTPERRENCQSGVFLGDRARKGG